MIYGWSGGFWVTDMERNYRIVQGIALEVEGLHLDLYNNYFLEIFSTSIITREMTLLFRLEKQFADGKRPDHFSLLFREVTFFEASYTMLDDDGMIVEEVGFKDRQDKDLAWLKQDGQDSADDDVIIRITGGRHIRVCAGLSKVSLSIPSYSRLAQQPEN